MGETPLLSVSHLSKNFGGVQAMQDVSFELNKGELLGLIGPNGSGKTTAVNLITGFVKPSEGEIMYQGRNITGMAPYKIVRLGIARTFQMVKPFYQLPAYKNMIIPLYSPRVKGTTGGQYGDRDAVALDLLEDKPPFFDDLPFQEKACLGLKALSPQCLAIRIFEYNEHGDLKEDKKLEESLP